MRESRTYGSVRGACDETHVPTATGVDGPLGAQKHPAHGSLYRAFAGSLQALMALIGGSVQRSIGKVGGVRHARPSRDELCHRARLQASCSAAHCKWEVKRRCAHARRLYPPTVSGAGKLSKPARKLAQSTLPRVVVNFEQILFANGRMLLNRRRQLNVRAKC
jgi:hypothetical protein